MLVSFKKKKLDDIPGIFGGAIWVFNFKTICIEQDTTPFVDDDPSTKPHFSLQNM